MGRSNIASLIDGFSSGYDMTGRVLRDSELARVAQSAPTEVDGRVSFLGKNYDAMPDQTTLDRGRQIAMAGVFDKHGEVQRGSELRQSVRRDEIADQGLAMQRERFDWEKNDRKLREKQQQEAETYAQAQKTAFSNSVIGQRSRAFSEQTQKYLADKDAYDAAVSAGRRDVVEPSPPSVTAPTVAEAMLFSAEMLANDAAHGKANPDSFLKLAETAKQVQAEGYVNVLKLAQSGAPLTQVLAKFNADGQVKIDPEAVVSDKMVNRGGVQSRVIVIKGPDGKSQIIDTLAELDSLDKADKLYTRAQQANTERRADAAAGRAGAAEGRAQAEFKAGAGERAGKSALGALQAELLAPGTTPQRAAEIQGRLAALQGVMGKGAKPAGYKVESGDVTSLLGTPAVNRKGEPIMDIMTGRQVVNRDPAKEQAFFRWMADNGITDTNEALARYPMLQGRGAAGAGAGAPGAAVPPPDKRVTGQTYETPRGPMIWNGKGWVEAASANTRRASGAVTQ